MKLSHIFKVILLLLLPFFVLAQYPNNPIKSRLGWQTTGDGLVYRGAGAPAYSPGTMFNAWMYLDTTNYALYMYRNFQWTKLPLVNNGLTLDGSYVQLGGTLVENTQVERSTYTLDFGKISGSNNGYLSFYGTDPHYVGILTTKDGTESGLTMGNKLFGFEVDDSDHTFQLNGTRFGFDATYLGTLGVSQFKMDSTRFYIRGLPTYATHAAADADIDSYGMYQITDGRTMYSRTGTADKVSPNIQDNGTSVSILSSKPFQLGQWTTAGRPTGTSGYMGWNTSLTGIDWYNGTRWATGIESTFARGTSGYFPRFDANGQIIDSEARVSSTNMIIALTGGLQIPSGTSAQQSSTGAGYLRWNTSLAYPTIFNGASTQSVLIGPFTGFASGEVMYGASSGGMPASATTFKWDIANSRLLVGASSHSFANTTRLVVQQATSNAFIADFRSTAATVFGPIAAMKLTRTDNTVGYGTTFAFYFNNAASAEVDYARFGAYIESNTTGAHSGGLAFYTTNLATTTQERFRVTSIGRIGINTTTPTHRLHVNGRARIDTTDATPTSIIGLDGNNVIGKLALGTGLSITSGTLNATGGTVTSVGLSLPAIFSVSGSPVTSSGTLSATFTGGNTRQVLRGDGIWANTLDSFRINQSLASVERFEVNGNLVLAREDEGHKLMLSRGWSQQIWGGGVTGDMTYQNGSGSGFQNYFRLGVSGGNDTIVTMHQSGLGVHVGKSNKLLARLHVKGLGTGSNKTMLLEDSGGADILTVTDNKLIQFNAYGTPATTAPALSKTLTNYGVGFATDGTVTSREIKRDTTIYVVDADYDFSAALTTAQVSSRYNRVIFLMTTTAAAGSDSELTLHTPDINLMQCEYLVRSTDEAGGFANVIRFGSNNAVDSTNGLVSSYFPAAGQGVGIRAGLRSGSYKYWYY